MSRPRPLRAYDRAPRWMRWIWPLALPAATAVHRAAGRARGALDAVSGWAARTAYRLSLHRERRRSDRRRRAA